MFKIEFNFGTYLIERFLNGFWLVYKTNLLKFKATFQPVKNKLQGIFKDKFFQTMISYLCKFLGSTNVVVITRFLEELDIILLAYFHQLYQSKVKYITDIFLSSGRKVLLTQKYTVLVTSHKINFIQPVLIHFIFSLFQFLITLIQSEWIIFNQLKSRFKFQNLSTPKIVQLTTSFGWAWYLSRLTLKATVLKGKIFQFI